MLAISTIWSFVTRCFTRPGLQKEHFHKLTAKSPRTSSGAQRKQEMIKSACRHDQKRDLELS